MTLTYENPSLIITVSSKVVSLLLAVGANLNWRPTLLLRCGYENSDMTQIEWIKGPAPKWGIRHLATFRQCGLQRNTSVLKWIPQLTYGDKCSWDIYSSGPESPKKPMVNLDLWPKNAVFWSAFTTVKMTNVFWDIIPCGSSNNRGFGGIYPLHLQGNKTLRGHASRRSAKRAPCTGSSLISFPWFKFCS
jgi:hypothetical protein